MVVIHPRPRAGRESVDLDWNGADRLYSILSSTPCRLIAFENRWQTSCCRIRDRYRFRFFKVGVRICALLEISSRRSLVGRPSGWRPLDYLLWNFEPFFGILCLGCSRIFNCDIQVHIAAMLEITSQRYVEPHIWIQLRISVVQSTADVQGYINSQNNM